MDNTLHVLALCGAVGAYSELHEALRLQVRSIAIRECVDWRHRSSWPRTPEPFGHSNLNLTADFLARILLPSAYELVYHRRVRAHRPLLARRRGGLPG